MLPLGSLGTMVDIEGTSLWSDFGLPPSRESPCLLLALNVCRLEHGDLQFFLSASSFSVFAWVITTAPFFFGTMDPSNFLGWKDCPNTKLQISNLMKLAASCPQGPDMNAFLCVLLPEFQTTNITTLVQPLKNAIELLSKGNFEELRDSFQKLVQQPEPSLLAIERMLELSCLQAAMNPELIRDSVTIFVQMVEKRGQEVHKHKIEEDETSDEILRTLVIFLSRSRSHLAHIAHTEAGQRLWTTMFAMLSDSTYRRDTITQVGIVVSTLFSSLFSFSIASCSYLGNHHLG